MNFNQFLLILKARKAIILYTLLATVVTTVAVSLIIPPTYTATTSLVINFKGVDPVTGLPLPAGLVPGYMATQTDIIGSHNVALKVVDKLKLITIPEIKQKYIDDTDGQGNIRDWLADLLLKSLKIDPSRESSKVDVSYKASDPNFAAAIANAFAQAYITTNLELKVEPAKQISSWYDGQVNDLKAKLDKAQGKLSAYQREHGIVNVNEQTDEENARLQELSAQLVLAQSQAYDAASHQKQMMDAINSGKGEESLPDIINNPLIQGLKGDLAKSESKLADISERTGKNHPEYQRAAAEVASLKQKINSEVKNAMSGISHNASITQARVNDLKSALAAQKARILNVTQKRDDLAVLTRDVDNAQKMLDAAMQRSGQTQLESQSTQTDIAVLNPAVPPIDPSFPKWPLEIILSVFMGTLMGLGLAFLREVLDRRLRSPEDLTEELGIPVLGILIATQPSRKFSFLGRIFRRPAAV